MTDGITQFEKYCILIWILHSYTKYYAKGRMFNQHPHHSWYIYQIYFVQFVKINAWAVSRQFSQRQKNKWNVAKKIRSVEKKISNKYKWNGSF
jgi:hypothetical protein